MASKTASRDDLIRAVEASVALIGGKWKPVLLFHLQQGALRFSELKKQTPEASDRMLTRSLRELEDAGLVTRTVYAEVPVRVEYTLSADSLSLLPLLKALGKWQLGRSGEEITLPAEVVAAPKPAPRAKPEPTPKAKAPVEAAPAPVAEKPAPTPTVEPAPAPVVETPEPLAEPEPAAEPIAKSPEALDLAIEAALEAELAVPLAPEEVVAAEQETEGDDADEPVSVFDALLPTFNDAELIVKDEGKT